MIKLLRRDGNVYINKTRKMFNTDVYMCRSTLLNSA